MKKILRVNALSKFYETKDFMGNKFSIKALNGATFELVEGETVGVVGESGCGKSTMAKTIIGLEKKSGGAVFINDRNIDEIPQKEKSSLVQMIFQDPYNSLNPRKKAWEIIAAPLKVQKKISNVELYQEAVKVMKLVGLPEDMANRFPHMFSGGQRQRIGIARALITKPKVIICDEPVSALDVSIQAQILNLLIDLQKKLNLSYVFIGHDLSVIKHIAHKVCVMYLGNIVEQGSNQQIFNDPKHPYTRALLKSSPSIDLNSSIEDLEILKGELPSPLSPPSGCHFHARCSEVKDECKNIYPNSLSRDGHQVKCHLYK